MKDLNQISVELEKLSVKINELSKNMSDVVDALKRASESIKAPDPVDLKLPDGWNVIGKFDDMPRYRLQDWFTSPCDCCPKNPKNGGDGVCHCTLGTKVVYSSTT